MQKTQAIETYYKNTRFRSRLEAKWALFFDELGIIWDYEPQGFESRGVRYLPDFYMPELDLFFECKPYAPSKSDFNKSAVGVEASGKTLILSWGYPAVPIDDRLFNMVDIFNFIQYGTNELMADSFVKFPSTKDRFGMVAIDQGAALTLLGDFLEIHLAKYEIGGLETVEFCRCPVCEKFYIGAEWNDAKYKNTKFICPFDCETSDAYECVVEAATKVRNHRFGKIA